MALRVVGAGLGRTGTLSLKAALEQLLGGPCYHMLEISGRTDDLEVWHEAVRGTSPDWTTFLADYRATVDWPACAFWRELMMANPDARVLLSTRSSADAWWKSANDTIFRVLQREPPADTTREALAHGAMARDMLTNVFTPGWADEGAAKRAYEAHNAEVRAAVAPDRLVEWQPGDGWSPICTALDLPVPDEPFPHANSTAEFRAMAGLDE
jgi:hypothetical protein